MGADWTPYEGLTVTGWPVVTIARGRVVVEAGGFHADAGSGRYLRATTVSTHGPHS
jgi:dihydropyrimidinase